jgi:hypothetical protein
MHNRLAFLRALVAVAEGAVTGAVTDAETETETETEDDSARTTPAQKTVATLLRDPRFYVMGGREGMPRSCGSVYAGAATRYLGDGFSGVKRTIHVSRHICFAASRDGKRFYVVERAYVTNPCEAQLRVFDVASGAQVLSVYCHTLSHAGLSSKVDITDLATTPDGRVFAVDARNDVLRVLSPTLEFIGELGRGAVTNKSRCIANEEYVVCSACGPKARFFTLFRIRTCESHTFDARHVARIQFLNSGYCYGLCFLPDNESFAAMYAAQVNMYTMTGERLRMVRLPVFACFYGIACSAFGELLVQHTSRGYSKFVLLCDEYFDDATVACWDISNYKTRSYAPHRLAFKSGITKPESQSMHVLPDGSVATSSWMYGSSAAQVVTINSVV